MFWTALLSDMHHNPTCWVTAIIKFTISITIIIMVIIIITCGKERQRRRAWSKTLHTFGSSDLWPFPSLGKWQFFVSSLSSSSTAAVVSCGTTLKTKLMEAGRGPPANHGGKSRRKLVAAYTTYSRRWLAPPYSCSYPSSSGQYTYVGSQHIDVKMI